MKKSFFKALLYQLLFHVSTGLVYTLSFGTAIENQLARNGAYGTIKWILFVYALIGMAALAFFYIRSYYNDIDARRIYIEGTRENADKSKFYKAALSEALFFTASSFIMQIPAIIIELSIGYGYSDAMFIEMLFICDLGIYERLSVWLGVPMILAVMFLVSFLGRFAVLRSWEKNRIRK